MTRTRYLSRDIGGALPEGALLSFVRYLPPDSALKSEMEPDNLWLSGIHTDMLLAQLHDDVAAFMHIYLRSHGAKSKRPKPLPRPGVSDGMQHVGSDPIPIGDFDDWYYGGDE